MRRRLLFIGIAVVAALIAVGARRLGPALRIGAGTVAHDLCSGTFVSGFDPRDVFAENLAPREGQRLVAWATGYDVDRAGRQVTARGAGVFKSRAVYYDGLGCILIHGAEPRDLPSASDLAAIRLDRPPLLPDIAGPAPVEPSSEKLKLALAHAFEEPDRPRLRATKAVVVLRDGRVIAERYAPGVAVDTPLKGHSMTKSVMNALVGILVREGRLKVDDRAPVAAWSDPQDPRHAITLEELMRMTSGLALDEENAGFANPSDRMLYLRRDMAAFAERAALIATPGTRWAYSSATTHILAQIVRDTAGGGAIDALTFAERELFGPLGMRHVTMEVDSTGTMIGANYMFASARDWARFGELYVDDGVVGGRRILPEGWVKLSSTPTLKSDYGAGFWVGRPAGIPPDAFFALGNLGQLIVMVPSRRLVIVRLGDATGWPGDIGQLRLMREVLEAIGDEKAVGPSRK